jgi:hypothetical protein
MISNFEKGSVDAELGFISKVLNGLDLKVRLVEINNDF